MIHILNQWTGIDQVLLTDYLFQCLKWDNTLSFANHQLILRNDYSGIFAKANIFIGHAHFSSKNLNLIFFLCVFLHNFIAPHVFVLYYFNYRYCHCHHCTPVKLWTKWQSSKYNWHSTLTLFLNPSLYGFMHMIF